jgi:putative transcriptional regulator
MASMNLTHQFLIAMPGMVDPNFAGSVVYVCEHNDKGALGLVINRPSDITLEGLFDKVELRLEIAVRKDDPVMIGGPVQTERGFVLHSPGTRYNSTLPITEAMALTTSKDVLEAIAAGSGPDKVLVTLGYSGWGAGQLEDEIGQNAWLTVVADSAVIFDTAPEARFAASLRLLGIDPANLTGQAGHA